VLFIFPTSVCADNAVAVQWPVDPGQLPYQFQLIENRENWVDLDRGWVNSVLFWDIDEDGLQEELTARNPGIVCDGKHRDGSVFQRWQRNVGVDFSYRSPCASLDGVWDVLGNGNLELVDTIHTEDHSRWLIERRRLTDGSLIASYPISAGPDNRPDNIWDGFYEVFGCFTAHTPQGPRRALAVACDAGHDQQPRGVMALCVATGEILWSYFVGPRPNSSSLHIVDLDGDERQEICFTGIAVNNLHGQLFNGTSDDRPMLFVLRDNGSLAWSHSLTPGTGGASLEILEPEMTGECVLALGTNISHLTDNELVLLDHRGTELARAEVGSGVSSIVASSNGIAEWDIVLGQLSGEVRRYGFDGMTTLKLRARAKPATSGVARIGMVEDVVPNLGNEIVVGVMGRDIWMLDRSLEPLAYLPDAYLATTRRTMNLWRPEHDSLSFITRGRNGIPGKQYVLAAVAQPFPWMATIGVTAVAGVGLAVFGRFRRRRTPADLRELRLQLLNRLKLADHGSIGALTSLRQLVWIHNTIGQGFVLEGNERDVYLNLCEDFLTVGLPNLVAATDLAELAELDGSLVRQAKQLVGALSTELKNLKMDGYGAGGIASIASGLDSTSKEADRVFSSLRSSVEELFQCDPGRIIARSLTANTERITAMHISVHLPETEAPLCRIDEEEMVFVLDNLIDNGIRAMEGSPRRELRFEWQEAADLVHLSVVDTGHGIDPESWDRIMAPGHSQRKGRGLGLPASQEILRKYGGSLSVKQSRTDEGTVMSLVIPGADASPGK